MNTKLKQSVMAGFDGSHGSADRVRRMHMVDAGPNQDVGPTHVAKYRCARCGTESEWQTANTISEIRRGIPCPKCNPPNAPKT
jgi:DNA-directed RNA polymerase subunit RPC12/RpoP